MTRTTDTILVAGASGALGRAIVAEALRRGLRVRALGRRRDGIEHLGAHEIALCDPVSGRGLTEAVAGGSVLISALGASVAAEFGKGYRGYESIDTPANLHLIEAAERAGVRRVVYVSVARHAELADLAYVRAHEQVVQALMRSRLQYAVLRPTGFFSAFVGLLKLAKRGWIPLIGNPDAKTNPIADEDLAARCVELALAEGELRTAITVGGPETFTRQEIGELAFQALGKDSMFVRLPPWFVRTLAFTIRPINPRISDFTRFLLAISSRDCIGEPVGERRLGHHLRSLATASSVSTARDAG